MNEASRTKGTDLYHYGYRSVPFVNRNPIQKQTFSAAT